MRLAIISGTAISFLLRDESAWVICLLLNQFTASYDEIQRRLLNFESFYFTDRILRYLIVSKITVIYFLCSHFCVLPQRLPLGKEKKFEIIFFSFIYIGRYFCELYGIRIVSKSSTQIAIDLVNDIVLQCTWPLTSGQCYISSVLLSESKISNYSQVSSEVYLGEPLKVT